MVPPLRRRAAVCAGGCGAPFKRLQTLNHPQGGLTPLAPYGFTLAFADPATPASYG
jgi:hypothetical protein